MNGFVFAFILGILVVQQLKHLPSMIEMTIVVIVAGCFVRQKNRIFLFFLIGVIWAVIFATLRLQDQLSENQQGQVHTIQGYVVGLPDVTPNRVRFNFSVSKPENQFPKKISLSWYYPTQIIQPGQQWQFNVKLKKPHGRYNPNLWDYEKWLFMQNIGAIGYVKNKPKPRLLTQYRIGMSVDEIRYRIAWQLEQLLVDKNQAAIIRALTIGDKSRLSQQQWKIFQQTGTVHLLAISGLHIGLIAGLCYVIVHLVSRWVGASSPQQIAAVFSMFSAIGYSALAGFSIPTQRALVMLSIIMMAIVWQRKVLASHVFSLAVLSVLLLDPLAIMSVGFWLSFVAVSFILYRHLDTGAGSKKGYIYSLFQINAVTAIALSPLLLYFFQQFSIISPLANFIVIPLISFMVVPGCLLAVFFLNISPSIAAQLLQWLGLLIEFLQHVLDFLCQFSYASFSSHHIGFLELILGLLGALILLVPRGVPGRYLGLVLFLPMLNKPVEQIEQDEWLMTLLDVGQGLSVVIETRHHVLVYDTGAKFSQQSDMGKAVVIPFLKMRNRNQIDTLLISHADIDHAGGAESIVKQMTVHQVMTSSTEVLNEFDPIHCQRGQQWNWDGVDFEVLFPSTEMLTGDNNNSCVLKVTSKYGSVLLTGDIEKDAEQWLTINDGDELQSDILLSPHHGSRTSSTKSFLTHIKPQYVLIPAGYLNRFHFPHPLVIKRYRAIGAKVYNTAESGAIIVSVNQSGINVQPSRESLGKYWNN